VSVVGAGERLMSLSLRPAGRAWQNVNIFIVLLVLEQKAYVDHSWYHLWNGLLPIFRVQIMFMACWAVCTGMKCALKVVIKLSQILQYS
jgi:hypothetical protein